MTIVSGSVKFMERRKIADYEHREAVAELSFSVPDDGDYRGVFDLAAAEATAQVRRMIQGFATNAEPMPVQVQDAAAKAAATEARAQAKTHPGGGGRPMGSKNAPKAAPVVPPAVAPVAADPAAVFDEDSLLDGADPAEVLDEGSAVVITDADVQQNVQATMKRLTEAGPVKPGEKPPAARIKDVIFTFAGPPPKRSTDVPAAQRSAFLLALAKL